jgi:hypothetical protein
MRLTSVVNSTRVSAATLKRKRVKRESDLAGKRYGEVLLVTSGETSSHATVYSFPLDDCPAELCSALEAYAVAAENGAAQP